MWSTFHETPNRPKLRTVAYNLNGVCLYDMVHIIWSIFYGNLKSKWWNVWKKTCNGCQPCFGIDNKITSLPACISLIPNWNIFPLLENFSIFGFCISLFFGIWFSKFSLILICDFLDWFEFHLTHRILTNRPMSRFSRTWVESTPCMNTICTKINRAT